VEIHSGAEYAQLAQLVDATIRVRGVWRPRFNRNRQLSGFYILVPDAKLIQVTRPAPAIQQLSVTAAGEVRSFQEAADIVHRVRVRGTVTAIESDEVVWLQDETGAARLEHDNPFEPLPKIGAFLEAVGFPRAGGLGQVLRHATWKAVPGHAWVTPLDGPPGECAAGITEGRLVRTEGFITNVERSRGDLVFSLLSGRDSFQATLEMPQPRDWREPPRVGSLVRLTGACRVDWGEIGQDRPRSMSLLLRDPADVQVLRAASWWTPEHSLRLLAVVCLALAGVVVVVLAMRQKLRLQNAEIRARLERESELTAQLVQAEKMESVGRLAGGIAHDFNNLLTVINGFTELLLAQAGAESKQTLEQILKAGNRAAALTRQLLAFSRKQVLQARVLDMNDVLKDVVAMLGRLIGEQIELITRLDPGLAKICVDPTQLEQVLVNLAVNARDAMPGGGQLIVETAMVELDERDAQVFDAHAGRYVRLTVTDTGSGMDAATRARVFEPFFTTKSRGTGTGLGLATVFGIVQQSGGHILVDSNPGHGTSFRIHFPVYTGPVEAVQQLPAKSEPAAVAESQVILVVEDQPEVRDFVCEVLRGGGYRVAAASRAEEAIGLFASAGHPDLLLTDVVLPDVNGCELSARLTTLDPALRTLYMSG
jgi:signal transduction histidine kinase